VKREPTDTFESRESSRVDNKQACPRVSHLVLTNNCGTLANICLRVSRTLANQCIAFNRNSVDEKHRERCAARVSRLFCKLYPLILMLPSWHQRVISILGVIACVPFIMRTLAKRYVRTILLIRNFMDGNAMAIK
jgi:hypothetical protein